MTKIVTRFAPSPTGFLHIGGARTALFNWLYARHHGGKFLLRIEDTDRERSTDEAIHAIIKGLQWLDLSWDDEIVFQFTRIARHQKIVQNLLDQGKAYYCYCTTQELEDMKEKARREGRQPRYDGRWRDRDPKDAPHNIRPVIRLKVSFEGETVIQDLVQGQVKVQNEQLDDMVLLRADQTPTYMLGVVVDDYDMGITHVIRGDDHLTNTFRQIQIYHAMGWALPCYSHLPLLLGEDGAKLSKRHGALGVEAYQNMGFLPEALCNYLMRLGWGHGDEEIMSRSQAIEWFDVKNVGRSPSRFDLVKLKSVNSYYLKESSHDRLLKLMKPFFPPFLQELLQENSSLEERLLKAMSSLKQRSSTLSDLASNALFLIHPRPLPFDEKSRQLLTRDVKELLSPIYSLLKSLSLWDQETLESTLRLFANEQSIKMGVIAQPLRMALTGQTVSPGIFEVMMALGQEETLERIKDML